MWWRRLFFGVSMTLLVATAVALVVGSRGTYATYPRAALDRAGAPAWTAPCRAAHAPRDRTTCARVSGRVIWRQLEDPDGDGDRHLIVVARLHARIVKLQAAFPGSVPGLGSRVDATGWLMRGASGHSEIDTIELRAGGEVKRSG